MNSARKIEIRHLRYFIAATEHGSFRKAADTLSIQESAISRRIRDMEDLLGASLFQRHSGGVVLTLAGQRFLRRARTALQQINDGTREVAAVGRSDEGRIRIGIFSSLASGFLADLLRIYDKDHAGVLIDLIDGNPPEHVAAIRQLRLDVAFITGTSEWSGCQTENLWSERVFAVLPVDHPLTAKSRLDWPDLAHESFIVSDGAPGQEIRDYLVQRLAGFGHHPDIHLQFVGRDNMLALVAIGRGLTLTSEATTVVRFPGIVYRPVANEILPFSAVWSPGNDNPACRRLLSLARSIAQSNSQAEIGRPTSEPPQSASPS